MEIHKGHGKHGVTLKIEDTGQGLVCSLCGGELPHVGAVALAVPRPSLSGEGRSCDVWIIPVPGHKEADLAADIARKLCRACDAAVSLTAGIHIDQAEKEDIELVAKNCSDACDEALTAWHIRLNS